MSIGFNYRVTVRILSSCSTSLSDIALDIHDDVQIGAVFLYVDLHVGICYRLDLCPLRMARSVIDLSATDSDRRNVEEEDSKGYTYHCAFIEKLMTSKDSKLTATQQKESVLNRKSSSSRKAKRRLSISCPEKDKCWEEETLKLIPFATIVGDWLGWT